MEITINLLPPEKKEELKNLRTIGTVIGIGTSAIFSIAVLFVFLQFCTKAILIQKNAFDKEVNRFAQTDAYREMRKSQTDIKKHSKQASQIKSGLLVKKSYWSVIDEINKMMPKDVYLRELSITEGTVSIKGFAFFRKSLLELEEELKQNENFIEIESPISNLVANENVVFEFKAKIKE